ncbi:hypothetical protein KAH43_06575 [Candidatus Bipolaricaulota bacterium]|nr:hypothetical protein [Candidatus Bipolaricaulota bacterium]
MHTRGKRYAAWLLVVGLCGLLLAGCTALWTPQDAPLGEIAPMAAGGKYCGCTTIQSGTLLASDGSVIQTGYDDWGYNYQAHLFNGMYCDSYRDAEWCQPYKDVHLSMKWNDAWMSNMDCDGDGKLDRHYGNDSYIGSGAWLTNHQSGEYENEEGATCKWTYFVKIVAAPADAVAVDGIWYAADGIEIGPAIWGAFAIIQEVENDPCAGIHGLQYLSPTRPGLGNW